MDAAVRKYLSGHEAPETQLAMPLVDQQRGWAQVLVVPVHAETPDFIDGYRAAMSAAKGHGLVIAVLNGRLDDSDEARAADLRLWAEFEAKGQLLNVGGSRACLCNETQFDLLVVDRMNEGLAFEAGQGVGLARKIGTDIGLALWVVGSVSRAWIHGTDADVRLARDHFDVLPPDPKCVASLAPFVHVSGGDGAVDEATLAYEMRLRWYVLGLRWAGSSFAHHSIGSTISVRPQAYAKVRGFPRREAGEDFYLLDKLAKIGRVQTRAVSPVFIRSRRSTRVPFGTGPAVERVLSGEGVKVYDPGVFEALLRLHGALRVVAGSGHLEAFDAVCGEPHLGPALAKLGLDAAIHKLVDNYPPKQLKQRINDAFDGFKTLRLVHELGAARWPEAPIDELWAQAEFLGDARREAHSFGERVAYLRRCEGVRLPAPR